MVGNLHHLATTLPTQHSILCCDADEKVSAQGVVHAGRHIAVHKQRVGGKSNDWRLSIGQIVDPHPDIQMLCHIDAAIQIEVVVGSDV